MLIAAMLFIAYTLSTARELLLLTKSRLNVATLLAFEIGKLIVLVVWIVQTISCLSVVVEKGSTSAANAAIATHAIVL